jgi:drug/metabolite transporter (DMT)-like permease
MTILKAVVAIVVSAAGALVVALGTGNAGTLSSLDTTHWLLAVGTVLGSGGIVWFTENGAAAPAIKAVVAFLSAGVASLVTALNDNTITQAEWLVAFVAAVTATGIVYQVRNTGSPNPPQG